MLHDRGKFLLRRRVTVDDRDVADEVVAAAAVSLPLRKVFVGRIALPDRNPGDAALDIRPAGGVHPLRVRDIGEGGCRHLPRTHGRTHPTMTSRSCSSSRSTRIGCPPSIGNVQGTVLSSRVR